MPLADNVTRRFIFVVLALALLTNAGLLFVALPSLTGILSSGYSIQFQDLYDQIANNVASGNGYRVEADMGETMMREPGYPLFLAVVFKIAGYHIEAARFANLLLAFGIGLLVIRLAHKITGDRMTGLLATLLFLFYPGTLVAEARAGVEISFIFLLMLFILFLYRAMEKEHLWRYCVAGMFMGAATLVRSAVLWFPLFLLVYLVLAAQGSREQLKAFARIAVLSFGVVVVISPWVIRNYILTNAFVPSASVAGMAVQEGLYTCQHLSRERDFMTVQSAAGLERGEMATRLGLPFVGRWYYQLFYNPSDELRFNKALLEGAAAEYRREPALLAMCGCKNLLFNFWFLGKTWKATSLNLALQAPLLMLSAGGIVVLWKRGLLRKAGVMLMFILYIPAVHAPIIAHARHSIVVVPFLAILASVSLVWVWNAWTARRTRRDSAATLLTLRAEPGA